MAWTLLRLWTNVELVFHVACTSDGIMKSVLTPCCQGSFFDFLGSWLNFATCSETFQWHKKLELLSSNTYLWDMVSVRKKTPGQFYDPWSSNLAKELLGRGTIHSPQKPTEQGRYWKEFLSSIKVCLNVRCRLLLRHSIGSFISVMPHKQLFWVGNKDFGHFAFG